MNLEVSEGGRVQSKAEESTTLLLVFGFNSHVVGIVLILEVNKFWKVANVCCGSIDLQKNMTIVNGSRSSSLHINLVW